MQTILFRDRTDAARRLAERLYWLKNEIEKSKSSVVIMAIPRGGIIIGNIIAKELRTKLDLVAEMINISQNYIESQIRKEVKEIERRLIEFRSRKEYENKLEDKIVVLVDDGIATGATILASTKWIKDKHNCKQLIIAVPLAPRGC
jgi:putative phosphoribosyl transferase